MINELWHKTGIELPHGVKEAMADKAKAIAGDKAGMGRYVWAVAAGCILAMSDEELYQLASCVRAHAERGTLGDKATLKSSSLPVRYLAMVAQKEKGVPKDGA